MTNQHYDLNLIPGLYAPVVVNVSQYDAGSRDIQMNIYNDALPFEIPRGSGVTVQGTKDDNTGFQYEATYDGNVVTWTVQNQMTVFSGVVPCEIKIVLGDQVLGTANFFLAVEPTALRDDTIISETDLPLLQRAADVAAYAPAVARDAAMAADAVDRAEEALQTVTAAVTTTEAAKTAAQTAATNAAASQTAAAASATAAAASETNAASSASDAADAAEQAQQGINEAKTVQNKSGSGSIEFGIDSTTGKGQYRATGASEWIPFLNEFAGEYLSRHQDQTIRQYNTNIGLGFSLAGYSEALVVIINVAGTSGSLYMYTVYHPTRASDDTWTVGNSIAYGGGSAETYRLTLAALTDTAATIRRPINAPTSLLLKYLLVAGIGGKSE